jgi:hypothetical protein
MDVFYSTTCGKHAGSLNTAAEALNWLMRCAKPRTACSITRVTVTDELVAEKLLLSYDGHRAPRKLKKRHHKRGLRKEIKRRRKQKRGKLR